MEELGIFFENLGDQSHGLGARRIGRVEPLQQSKQLWQPFIGQGCDQLEDVLTEIGHVLN